MHGLKLERASGNHVLNFNNFFLAVTDNTIIVIIFAWGRTKLKRILSVILGTYFLQFLLLFRRLIFIGNLFPIDFIDYLFENFKHDCGKHTDEIPVADGQPFVQGEEFIDESTIVETIHCLFEAEKSWDSFTWPSTQTSTACVAGNIQIVNNRRIKLHAFHSVVKTDSLHATIDNNVILIVVGICAMGSWFYNLRVFSSQKSPSVAVGCWDRRMTTWSTPRSFLGWEWSWNILR